MGNILEINADTFERDILKSDILVIVDFWHEHCPWCLRLNPLFDQVSEEYQNKVKFAKLNVIKSPENRDVASKYGVIGTPTLKFFCGGRPVEERVGFLSKEQLKKSIDDVLAKHRECINKSTELT